MFHQESNIDHHVTMSQITLDHHRSPMTLNRQVSPWHATAAVAAVALAAAWKRPWWRKDGLETTALRPLRPPPGPGIVELLSQLRNAFMQETWVKDSGLGGDPMGSPFLFRHGERLDDRHFYGLETTREHMQLRGNIGWIEFDSSINMYKHVYKINISQSCSAHWLLSKCHPC